MKWYLLHQFIFAHRTLAESLYGYFNSLNFHVSLYVNQTTSKGYDLYRLSVKKASVLSFKEWLYTDSTIYLQRKRDKFESDGSGYVVTPTCTEVVI